MFFCNARRKSVPKEKRISGESPSTSRKESACASKKAKIDTTSTQRNLDLLRKAKQSDFSRETFKKLEDETYQSRREFIQHEAQSTEHILEHHSFLSEPDHVSYPK